MPSVVSRAQSELPDIDDRLVEPETRYEMLDGELVYVAPADQPHARRHAKLGTLLETHAFREFTVSCDQLTRTSKVDDVAPDVSVYPEAPDPRTGGRQLDQLAFEVVSTQSLGHAGRKAAKLTARGVRRVFAIDVERLRVLEWSAETGTWRGLDPAGHIVDAALEMPLPVAAMLDVARADDEVARALVARRNPVFEVVRAQDRAEGRVEGRTEGRAEGRAEGRVEGRTEGRAEAKGEAVLAILAARRITVGDAERVRILGEDNQVQLDRWIVQAVTCTDVAELFTASRR